MKLTLMSFNFNVIEAALTVKAEWPHFNPLQRAKQRCSFNWKPRFWGLSVIDLFWFYFARKTITADFSRPCRSAVLYPCRATQTFWAFRYPREYFRRVNTFKAMHSGSFKRKKQEAGWMAVCCCAYCTAQRNHNKYHLARSVQGYGVLETLPRLFPRTLKLRK